MKLYSTLESVLKSESTISIPLQLLDSHGDLMLNKIHDLVDKTDEKLIGLLLENQELRDKFFIKIKDVYVFKTNDFKFFLDENKIDNSYTQYENRIGLTAGGKFLKDSSYVVLDFPYKDCILEGGQSTEEGVDVYFEYDPIDGHYLEKQAKRKEIFFNSVLAKDEIDRLLEPKAFVNVKKYTVNGEGFPFDGGEPNGRGVFFTRDENGMIKDNLIIKGNNLLALHTLKSEFTGKVKLIYIDPPYNTGSDSFAYNDNFNHSTWLTFMRNRLLAAKELLREDGFLCCHIDNNEGEYLKVLLDEIFKRENELNTFYVRVRYPDKTLKQDMDFHKEIETILIYRNSNQAKPILNEIETNNDKYIFYFQEVGAGKEIELGGKRTIIFSKDEIKIVKGICSDDGRKEIWATGSILDGNSSGRFFRDYLTGRYNEDGYGFVYKVYGVGDEVDGYRYFTGPQKVGATKGKYFQGMPSKALKEENNLKKIPINNFYDLAGSFGNCRSEGGVEFRSGKKPEDLLNVILKHFSDVNDIVLDYHLGSGSTCATSHKMERQYIGIEQMESQVNLSKTRLQNVINRDQTGISKSVNWKGGGSFIYLELAKNNQNAIEYIQSCTSYQDLVNYFEEMCDTYFLHYNVKVKEFREVVCKEENFKKLTFEQQKTMFAKMLDLNQLYVNASDMEDSRYALSESDVAVTKDFYQL